MSRSEVGCHSLIRPVTAGFAPSCAAYTQTDGPNGVRQQATAVTTATASARWRRGEPLGDVGDPGEPEHGRRQEEAAVDVRPQDSDGDDQPQPPRVRSTIDDEEQRQREQRHRDELRPQRQRGRRDGERAERQPRRGSNAGPLATAQLEDRGRDEPDQGGPEEHEPGPPAHAVDGGQDDLRAPLLVEPRLAGDRERPRVDGRDAAGRQDLLARPQVVRQVGRGQRRDERGQHGQRHGEERPQMPEAHETASYACPVRACTAPKVLGASLATYVADVLRSSHGRGRIARAEEQHASGARSGRGGRGRDDHRRRPTSCAP